MVEDDRELLARVWDFDVSKPTVARLVYRDHKRRIPMDLVPATGSTGYLLDDEWREEPLVRRQDDKLNIPDPCYIHCSKYLPGEGNRDFGGGH